MKTVFFLVLMGWNNGGHFATSGLAIIPVPYGTIEACQEAAMATKRADKNEPAARQVWLYCVPSEVRR
jgi:hypothetical protein